jgi:hypothetical protein
MIDQAAHPEAAEVATNGERELHLAGVEFFPGTARPIPPLLTPAEVVRILRLDVLTKGDGTEKRRALPDAIKSLDHLCRTRKLHPICLSKSRTFSRDDVLALVNGRSSTAEESP